MTKLIKIQPHIEVKVPDYFPEEREVDVKVIFRASEDGNIYFGPLECYGSIHKNKTMLQLQQEFRKNYENQGYEYVEITQVLIDEEFLKEYKADAKIANKEESEKIMNLIHSLLADSHKKQ